MNRYGLITAAATALLISAGGALAAPATDYVNNPVVEEIGLQLASQGYVIVDIERTWLGRLKIDAIANGFEREIIISAVSGMVLHDDWEAAPDKTTAGLDGNGDGIADTLEEGPGISSLDNGESDGGSGSASENDAAMRPIVIDSSSGASSDEGSDGGDDGSSDTGESGDSSSSDGSDNNVDQD